MSQRGKGERKPRSLTATTATVPERVTFRGASSVRGGRGGTTRGGTRGGASARGRGGFRGTPLSSNDTSSADKQYKKESNFEGDDELMLTQSQFFKDLQIKAFEALDNAKLREKKLEIINIVSSSLIKEPRFNKVTPALESIITTIYQIAYYDPEFVLKLSLYTRTELGIRTVANYLLSLAAVIPPCQPYLKKYYQSTIRLPSDWLEIPNIVSKLTDSNTIPKSLRNVMVDKFTDFDTYQLGKYSTEGKIKRNRKKLKAMIKKNPSEKDKLTKEFEEKQSGSLKQMIRVLHISQPNQSIMSILGKKYPATYEDFIKMKLPGEYDPERAGKRMKLPVPETWETMLSEKGNKAQTWTELIDNNKLPFLASLRNLRNLLITGVHPRIHDGVLRNLRNRSTISRYQTFPLQFLAAYSSIPKDTEQLKKLAAEKKVKIEFFPPADLLDRYRDALDTAIKLSTIVNVKPIRGTTVVFVYVGGKVNDNCSSNRSGRYTQLESAILLGLMCKYVCEECELILIGKDISTGQPLLHSIRNDSKTSEQKSKVGEEDEVEEDTGDSILKKMESIKTLIDSMFDQEFNDSTFPTDYIMKMILEEKRIDNLLVLSHMFIKQDTQPHRANILTKYRQELNPDLLFVSINLSGGGQSVSNNNGHANDVYISGFSDSILKFVAERGGVDQQLSYIEKIDEIKKLKNTAIVNVSQQQQPTVQKESQVKKEEKLVGIPTSILKPWKNIRVFISSTFLDMHGERNQLVKYVFPELRERCAKRKIHITEIDLRWGITEDEAQKNRSVELCLDEVDRCRPFFVGLLGQRYGWVPTNYKLSEEPQYDWIRNYPKGRSITELEMVHSAFNESSDNQHALFYIRDNSGVQVPKEFKSQFECEDKESGSKLENLKTKIRENCRYYTYQASWGGVIDGQPQVIGLEDFHDRVLEDLWQRIVTVYPEEVESVESIDMMAEEEKQQEIYQDVKTKRFVGRRDELNCMYKFCEVIKQFGSSSKVAKFTPSNNKSNILLLTGKGGCGKTSLIAHFIKELQEYREENQHKFKSQLPWVVVSHFIGSTLKSTNVAEVLYRIAYQVIKKVGMSEVDISTIPTDYKQLKIFTQSLLKKASSRAKIFVFIDAIDQLEAKNNAKTLDWIPSVAPVKMIISTVDGDHSQTLLRRRKVAPMDLVIDAMDQRDSQVLVTSKLADYRKKLDESVTNNQMRMLLGKSDANNPLYLVLACEELRYFGGFNELTDKIKSLSPTLAVLFQDILVRLESDHSKHLVSTVLGSIACCRVGLTENDLRVLTARKELKEDILPIGIWSKFFRSIQSFVQVNADQTVDFFHHQMKLAVVKKYLSFSDSIDAVHKQMATYYQELADPKHNLSYVGALPKAISELPYHLSMCKSLKPLLESVLCNLAFVEKKCSLGMTYQLVGDYVEALGDQALDIGGASTSSSSMSSAKAKLKAAMDHIMDFYTMVSSNSHILARSPELTYQQAINQPSTSYAHKVAKQHTTKKTWIEWNNKLENKESCRQTLTGFGEGTTALANSPNGQIMAVASRDCNIRLLSPTGVELNVLSGIHTNWISSLSFSKDGKVLASAGWDEKVVLWDVVVGAPLHTFDKSHERAVNCVRFSPTDNALLISAGWDGRAVLFNAVTKSVVKTIYAHDKPINHCTWSNDGNLVATTGWDATIRVWKVLEQPKRTPMAHILDVSSTIQGSIKSCEFSPSGKQIIATSMDGNVMLFDIASSKLLSKLGKHTKSANYCAFSDDGEHIVTSSDDNTAKVWTPSLGCEIGSTKIEGNGDTWANCMAYSYTFGLLAMGCSDCSVRLYQVNGGVFKQVAKLDGHVRAVHSVSFSHDQTLLASTAEDRSIIVWDVVNRKQDYQIPNAHNDQINSVSFSPNSSNLLLSCSDDFKTHVWSRQTCVATLSGSTNNVKNAIWSPNGTYIATVSRDCAITIYLAKTYRESAKLTGHTDWINFCAFSADSKRIVSGGWDFNLKVWSMNSKKELISMKGHTGSIERGFFTDNYVISCSFDSTIKVWDPEFGSEITSLTHASRVSDIVQSNDGTGRIFSCSDDGIVKCWNPVQGQCITTLTGHSSQIKQSVFLNKQTTSSSSSSSFGSSTVNTQFNKNIVTGSSDGSVKVWEFSNQTISSTSVNHNLVYVSVSFDGHHVAGITRDGSVVVLDSKNLSVVKSFPAQPKVTPTVCSFNKGGQLIVGKDNGEITIISKPTSSAPEIKSFGVHTEKVTSISPLVYDDTTFATGSWDRSLQMWAEGQTSKISTLPDWIECLAFAPNGDYIAVGGRDNEITISRPNLATSTISSTFDSRYITSMVCSPNSELLAIGTFTGNLEVYNFTTKSIVALNTTQKGAISGLKFINNTHLVSCSKDNSLIIYNIEKNEIENEFIHNSPITSMDIKSNKIFTTDSNGNLYQLIYHPTK